MRKGDIAKNRVARKREKMYSITYFIMKIYRKWELRKKHHILNVEFCRTHEAQRGLRMEHPG